VPQCAGKKPRNGRTVHWNGWGGIAWRRAGALKRGPVTADGGWKVYMLREGIGAICRTQLSRETKVASSELQKIQTQPLGTLNDQCKIQLLLFEIDWHNVRTLSPEWNANSY
jgi:hypothetical protein